MTLDEYILLIKNQCKNSVLETEDEKILVNIVAEIHNNSIVIKNFILQTGFKIVDENITVIIENSSPVCYANDSSFREEFRIDNLKETITYIDLLHYIFAIYKLKAKKDEKLYLSDLLYSIDKSSFNGFARLGKQMVGIHF